MNPCYILRVVRIPFYVMRVVMNPCYILRVVKIPYYILRVVMNPCYFINTYQKAKHQFTRFPLFLEEPNIDYLAFIKLILVHFHIQLVRIPWECKDLLHIYPNQINQSNHQIRFQVEIIHNSIVELQINSTVNFILARVKLACSSDHKEYFKSKNLL